MIELEEYSVVGLKSLADVATIPVRKPTIITGANDGGKSTTLRALDFLLGGKPPALDDHSVLGPGADGAPALREERIVVTGKFALQPEIAAELQLPTSIRLRRSSDPTGGARYEVQRSVPADEDLRSLETLKLQELQEVAERHSVEPQGKRNARASWLAPLEAYAATRPHDDAWVPALLALVSRLPRILMFSSTVEPDPEGQIRSALKEAFSELLDDNELVGPVRAVESAVQSKLAERAKDLCSHVADRCPELATIEVVPEVTFTEGFRDVQVVAAREGGANIALNQSGAGRRRRVNLAIWEWTANLLDARDPSDRSVVIAYDEPDTHLDYARQRDLVGLIQQQCAKPGVRMLVATHSLNLIDRVAIEDVVHLRLEHDRTTVERLVSSEHAEIERYLSSVSEAMGLRNSVLLHERCFLGVEGPTEVQAVPLLFRLATGMSLQSAGIALIAGNGNDGALNVVRFLKEHGRRMAFVLADRDSTDRKLFRPDKLRACGVEENEVFYIGARELEDVFSDEQWATAANKHWPRDDKREWVAADFAGWRCAPKFSKAIDDSVRLASSNAPPRKPGYLTALVQDIRDRSQLPQEFVTRFSEIASMAAA